MRACAEIDAMKGAGSKYAADCRVRAVRDLPFAEALAALDLPSETPEIVIQAGIGTLVMRPGVSQFTAAPTALGMLAGAAGAAVTAAQQLLAGEAVLASVQVRETRLVICRDCPLWDASGGRCRACGCHGTAKAALAASRCPEGRWEAQGAATS